MDGGALNDALTIGNAACGTITLFLCLNYLAEGRPGFLWAAFLLLPAALVCDVLDGYVTRLNPRRQSVLGADLDTPPPLGVYSIPELAIIGMTEEQALAEEI